MRERRKYTKEFKKESVEYSLSQPGKTITEVAKALGIKPDILSRWKIEYNKNKTNAFPGNGNPKDKELFELKKQIADLREENEILKKAAAIFSKGII